MQDLDLNRTHCHYGLLMRLLKPSNLSNFEPLLAIIYNCVNSLTFPDE